MPSLPPKFWKELNAVIAANNGIKVNGTKSSFSTQAKRRKAIHKGFRDLAILGCRLESPQQFKVRHMKKLAAMWEERGDADIQTKISFFRTFANKWLEKPSMIQESAIYVKNPASVKRRYITNADKTWSGNGVDVLNMIQKVAAIDTRVSNLLELAVAFGMRMHEAMLFRPHLDDERDSVWIRSGKGGRVRSVTLDGDPQIYRYQREVIERAKTFALKPHHSMIPADRSFDSYRNRIYYILRKAGVSRKDNSVTFHGLRHEYAVAYYEKRTGVAAPIKGKSDKPDPGIEQVTLEDLSENLGHSRTSIVGCYIGSRHQPLPQSGKNGESSGEKITLVTPATTSTTPPTKKE